MKVEIFGALKDRFTRVAAVVGRRGNPPVSPRQVHQWLQEAEALEKQFSSMEATPRWIIHGDYRAQNLKFDNNNRIRAVLDLDMARPANRTFDVAYALVFFPAVYQDTPLTQNQKSIFLRAYETVCPLSEAERKMFPSHLRLAFLRGMSLWLHLHYFAGMSERTRPWIQGYLNHAETITSEFYLQYP